MNRPLFSCVVPVKGERPFMKAALASLEAQGMGSDLEIIIQDGDVEPDKGQSDAPHKGFAKSKGEWLFWLNADDILLLEVLNRTIRTIEQFSEVWVHSMWLPQTMLACWKVIRAGKELVRMTHANLDPVRYHYHGWKKRLVAPIERWLFKHTDRVVVTCEAEKKWCQEWGLENEFEILDLKKFFNLEGFGDQTKAPPRGALTEYRVSPRSDFRSVRLRTDTATLHLLYLGRRHPLKGVNYLEQAVDELKNHPRSNLNRQLELHCVSNHFGEELERDWSWCDVLVLPTLSENFGLVVAEALERGKYVITTDGAPAWDPDANSSTPTPNNYTYIRGYRDGTDEERVRLLKEALEKFQVEGS